jgi:hypothetical protein
MIMKEELSMLKDAVVYFKLLSGGSEEKQKIQQLTLSVSARGNDCVGNPHAALVNIVATTVMVGNPQPAVHPCEGILRDIATADRQVTDIPPTQRPLAQGSPELTDVIRKGRTSNSGERNSGYVHISWLDFIRKEM